MCRNPILAATALVLVLGSPGFAGAKSHKDASAAATAAAQPAATRAQAPAPEPAHKATAEERAMAERLDPLARAAFWAHEVEIDGRDVQAGVRLAASLRALGRNEEAAQTAQQMLVVDPDNQDAELEIARDFLAGGQGFFAIDHLKRLQAANAKDWRPLSLLGVAYEQVSRDADAETAWKQALVMSPNNPAVLSNLAMHVAARGDAAQAEGLLRQAAAQPAAGLQVRQTLALVLGLEGKFAEAESITRQDLPPEMASNNIAYLHAAAAGGGDSRSWSGLQNAQAAAQN